MKNWLISNVGRKKLHPAVDEGKRLTVFPIRCTGGTSPFNATAQLNVNASTPSVSGQIYFAFVF